MTTYHRKKSAPPPPDTLLNAALQYGAAPNDELMSAWNSMGQAKTQLRRTQRKLSEMDKPLSSNVLWNLPDFLFSLIEPGALEAGGMTGEVSDLRQEQEQDERVGRKTSRRADRYTNGYAGDQFDDSLKADSLRSKEMSGISALSSIHPPSTHSSIHPPSTYSSTHRSHRSNGHHRSVNHQSVNHHSVNDETSLTAVLDTDIRYLNDVSASPRGPRGRQNPPDPRRNKANIQIPVMVERDWVGGGRGIGERVNGGWDAGGRNEGLLNGHDRRSVTFQQPLTAGVPHQSSNDGMERLREMIRQRGPAESADQRSSSAQQDFSEQTSAEPMLPRKVALGPTGPTWRGFSLPESPDDRFTLISDPPDNNKPTTAEPSFVEWTADGGREKPGRIVAVQNNNANRNEFITPSSWRVGARAAQQELGSTFTLPARLPPPPTPLTQGQASSRPQRNESEKLEVRHSPEDSKRRRVDRVESNWMEKPRLKTKKSSPVNAATEPKPPPPPAREPTYDAGEVRRYMERQKAERRLQQQQHAEAAARSRGSIQQQLQQLGRKQAEAVARAKKRPPPPPNRVYGGDDGSNKENEGSSRSSDSEESGGAASVHSPRTAVQASQAKERSANASERPPLRGTSAPPGKGPLGPAGGEGRESGDLTAEQIVARFASESGLSLTDVVRNYAKYANDIQRSFISTNQSKQRRGVVPPPAPAPAAPPRAGARSRLEDIIDAAQTLQARLQHQTNALKLGKGLDPASLNIFVPPPPDSFAALKAEQRGGEGRGVENKRIRFAEDDGPVFSGDLPGVSGRGVAGGDDPGRVFVKSDREMVSLVHLPDDGAVEIGGASAPGTSAQQQQRGSPVLLHHHRSEQPAAADQLNALLCPLRPTVPQWRSSKVVPDPYSILQIFSRRHKEVVLAKQAELALSVGITDITPLEVFTRTGGARAPTSDRDAPSQSLRDASPPGSPQSGAWSVRSDERLGPSVPPWGHAPKNVVDSDGLNAHPQRSRGKSHRSKGGHVTPQGLRGAAGVKGQQSGEEEYLSEGFDEGSGAQQSGFEPAEEGVNSMALVSAGGSRGERGGPGRPTAMDVDEYRSDFSAVSSLTPDSHPSRGLTPDSHPARRLAPDSHPGAVQSESGLQVSTGLAAQPARLGYLPVGGGGAEGGKPGLAPSALEARMALELNLLDCVDESLRQVDNIERTRAVALAQQETVALAQILKARQQGQTAELQAARLQVGEASLAAARQREEGHAAALERHQQAAHDLVTFTTNSAEALQGALRALAHTQLEAARMSDSAGGQDQQLREPSVKQLLAESAAAAAAAAAASVLQQLQGPAASGGGRKSSKRPVPQRSSTPVKLPPEKSTQSSGGDSGSEDSGSAAGSKRGRRGKGTRSSVESDAGEAAFPSHSPSARSVPTSPSRPPSSRSITSLASTTPRGAGDATMARSSAPSEIATDMSRPVSARSMSAVSEESELQTGSDRSRPVTIRTASRSTGGAGTVRTGGGSESEGEEKGRARDYSLDTTSMTDDDFERSLREVIPSERQRKKLRRGSPRPSPDSKDARPGGGEHDGSFSRFSVAIVQQYVKEERIRQQHQHTLLLLRQRALKEKTAAELRWLEQQQQQLRSKGADDQHPDLIRKRRRILAQHRQQQEELARLQDASRLAMEAQRLMLQESHGITAIQRMTQLVRDQLKAAGVDHSYLTSPDITTEEDVSLHLEDEDMHFKQGDGKRADKPRSKEKSIKMLDKKYLTEREQQLRHRRSSAEAAIRAGDEKNRNKKDDKNQNKRDDKIRNKKDDSHKQRAESPSSPRPIESALSIATELATPDPTDTARTDTIRTDTGRSDASRSADNRPPTGGASASISEHIDSAVSQGTQGGGGVSVRAEVSADRRRKTSDTATASSDEISEHVSATSDKGSRSSGSLTHSPGKTDYTPEFESASSHHASYSTHAKEPAGRGTGGKEPGTKTSAAARASHGKEPRGRGTGGKSGEKGSAGIKLEKPAVSDSEESLNHSVSDQSNLKGRVEDLAEELRERKREAEALRKRQTEKRKGKLREDERQLKLKIEKYNSYIAQVQSEVLESTVESAGSSSEPRPLVPPSVSPSVPLAVSPHVTPPASTASVPFGAAGSVKDSGTAKSSQTASKAASKPKINKSASDISEEIFDESAVVEGGSGGRDDEALLRLDLGVGGGDVEAREGDQGDRPNPPGAVAIDSARTLDNIPDDFSEMMESVEVSEMGGVERAKQTRGGEGGPASGARDGEDKSQSRDILRDQSEKTKLSEGQSEKSMSKQVMDKSAKSVTEDIKFAEDEEEEEQLEHTTSKSLKGSASKHDVASKPDVPSSLAAAAAAAAAVKSPDVSARAKSSDRSSSYSADFSEESSNTESRQKSSEKSVDQSGEKLVGRSSEKSDGKSGKKLGEKSGEKSVQNSAMKLVDKLSETRSHSLMKEDKEPDEDKKKESPATEEDISEVVSDEDFQSEAESEHEVLLKDVEGLVAKVKDAEGVEVKVKDDEGEPGKVKDIDEAAAKAVEPAKTVGEKTAEKQKEDASSKRAAAAEAQAEDEDTSNRDREVLSDAAVVAKVKDSMSKDTDTEISDRDVVLKDKTSATENKDSVAMVMDPVVSDAVGKVKDSDLIIDKNESLLKKEDSVDSAKTAVPKGYEESTSLNSLLNEAIDAMVGIHRTKQADQASSANTKLPNQASSADTRGANADRDSSESDEHAAMPPRNRRVLDRPGTPPLFASSTPLETKDDEMDLDDIYKELTSFKIDDWTAAGATPRQIPKPVVKSNVPSKPPPIPSPPQPPVLIYRPTEAIAMVHRSVDQLWTDRTSTFDPPAPPPITSGQSPDPTDDEKRSRASFDRLVFDLSAQALSDLYPTQSEPADPPPWVRSRPAHRSLPTAPDSVKPAVEERVLSALRLEREAAQGGVRPREWRVSRAMRWMERRRRERVDEVLVSELEQEEQQWTEYDGDELNIKWALADSLLELLLADTASAVTTALNKRQASQ